MISAILLIGEVRATTIFLSRRGLVFRVFRVLGFRVRFRVRVRVRVSIRILGF